MQVKRTAAPTGAREPSPGARSRATDYDATTDDELAAAASTGDLAAFAALYRRYVTSVRRWVGARANPGDVEDVTQETFAVALSWISGYVPRAGAPFLGWLIGGCAQRAMQECRWGYWRAQQAEALSATQVADALREEIFSSRLLASPGEGTEDDVAREDQAVLAAVAALPVAERTIIELFYLRGQSMAVAAKTIRRGIQAAYQIRGDALRQLRESAVRA